MLENLINKDRPTEERICPKHGAYTSTNYLGEHWTECPKCMIERRDAEAKLQIERDKQAALEREQRRWMSKIKGAAIPERFKDRTLDSYVAQTSGQQKALAFAKEYAQNFDQVIKTGRSAIFVGKPGTGKVIDAFASPDLLILDEVGVQFGSEFEKQLLFDVLNERYEKLKPSILLSNIPSEQLSDYLGERVTDRLRENGGALIGFNWDSYRKNL